MTTIRSDANVGIVIDSDTSGNITFVTGGSNIALQINSSGAVDLSSSRLILPVGNNSTRANVIGVLRFNNESNLFEAYNGTNWANISTGPPILKYVDYLVVGGGGAGGYGGGGGYVGGGGGAGGVRTSFDSISGGGSPPEPNILITLGSTYFVSIGSGSSLDSIGNPTIFDDITANGGGRGGTTLSGDFSGVDGASGGGGASQNTTGTSPAGLGKSNEGYPGGEGYHRNGNSLNIASGGGGGAGQAGANATAGNAGKGGDGISSTISGANVFYGGGGGGGLGPKSATAAPGGEGGGGRGGDYGGLAGTNGEQNTGGGGGAGSSPSIAGGSGVIILRYPSDITITADGGLTSTTDSANVAGYKITTITAGTGFIEWS